jgi:MFS family permease
MPDSDDLAPPSTGQRALPWYRELTRYHWLVLVVAALGWMFDTMDQQLFNLARAPAIADLRRPPPQEELTISKAKVAEYGGYATSIFMVGWATGGIAFGVLGDRLGRARTMALTILVYSIFTGLSALSVSVWDFALYRFLTGLGVGGQFAVGVALVAEVMPDSARTPALGWLQAMSAVGNMTAALVSLALGSLERSELIGRAWRYMFLVGALPALLVVIVMLRLKEPVRWQKTLSQAGSRQNLGSISELFGTPRWRRHAIIGMLLAFAGVVGLWGIGFFSFDLTRSVFIKPLERDARDQGEEQNDRAFVQLAVLEPDELSRVAKRVRPNDLLDADAVTIYRAALSLRRQDERVTAVSVLADLDRDGQSPTDRQRRSHLLEDSSHSAQDLAVYTDRIASRVKSIDGQLTFWAGITSLLQNFGGFFGVTAFSLFTQYTGRRPAFAVAFLLALSSTAFTFWFLSDYGDIFWMIPIMGFCQIALFGGYAIYFPELFPTRLRSTGTSFCYNVGRYVAAIGPLSLGILTSEVFAGYPREPMRYAGVTMCAFFLIGLLAVPFAPETKGQPLPE